MIYGDNQRLNWRGFPARVVCANNRGPDTPYPVTTGHDEGGDFVRFATEQGDVSAQERAAYGPNGKAAKRAMIGVESLGGMRRYGRRLVHSFGIVLEAGKPLYPNLFTVLSQENAAPPKGKGWRPPPMEFGLAAIARPRSHDVDEFFYLKGHLWNDERNKATDTKVIRSKQPVRRLQRYEVTLIFADGRSDDGFLEFRLDSGDSRGFILQGRYRGPVGYADFGSPYPAFGVYQHWGQLPLAARFYDWRETVEE